MGTVHRPRCFLDVSIGAEPAGRLIIELFVDKVPKTCENFRQLCTGECNGLSYAQAPFHRVIDEFMIQGGDIAAGDGTGTASIYGGEFEDENLEWRAMDAAGLICSANRGRDTNGSQFFITLEPCPHLNGKHTIFGRLVSGQDIVERIAKAEVDKDDRPLEPVLIARCGELEKRKKTAPPPLQSAGTEESAERGRRRKSDSSDDEMRDIPQIRRLRRARRQSDNIVDEGLRGRPRQRSRSRSASQALSTSSTDQSDEQQSPVKKHKRKRNSPPSRHKDRRQSVGGDNYEPRRRRSLPNQYFDDDERYKPSPRRADDRYAGWRRDSAYRSHHDEDRGARYRPRDRYADDGRLGGGNGYDDNEPPVKFKGRGVMKYREPGRL